MLNKEVIKAVTVWQAQREGLRRAIDKFMIHESELLMFAGQERPATHRLAIHLDSEFRKEWDVDCEYGKANNETKGYWAIITNKQVHCDLTEEFLQELCARESVKLPRKHSLSRRAAIPDVIIHHRRKTEVQDNLLYLEAKFNQGPSDLDRLKLMIFTHGVPLINNEKKELRYQLGMFVTLPKVAEGAQHICTLVKCRVFSAGTEITEAIRASRLLPDFEIDVTTEAKKWQTQDW